MFDALPTSDLHVSDVIVYGAAYHTDRSVPHNEVNPGLGLRFKGASSEWFYMIGDYQNSQWKNSTYFGVGKEFWRVGPLSVSAIAGAITGYNRYVLPVVLPEVALHFGSFAIAVDFVPPSPLNPGVFGFSIIHSF